MSGRPVLQKLERYIDEKGGDEWLLDQIASGTTPGQIAASIELPGHGTISRPLLYQWRNAGGQERREAWKEAMRSRGEQLVEESGEVLDELAGQMPTSAEVSLARSRSEYKRWLGGKLNDDYSDKPGDVNIAVVNVDNEFAKALKKHGQRRALPTQRPAIQEADYEVEE